MNNPIPHPKRIIRILLYGASGVGLLLLLSAILRSISRVPGEGYVRAAFLGEHPGYTVISVAEGEGDSDSVYFHIRYRMPGEGQILEQEVLYQRLGGNNWTLTWKGEGRQSTETNHGQP